MSHHERRYDPAHRGSLVSLQRQARWDPLRFLARFGLRAGQTALDLGCGPGFWTLPLSEFVGPAGRVWALDVSREMLVELAKRQPPQVRSLQTELPLIPLRDGAVDLAWGAFVLHEVEPPQRLVAELRRVVRPGGRAAILEWRPDAASDRGPPRAHRLSPQRVTGWLREAGFAEAAQTWQDADTHLVEAF